MKQDRHSLVVHLCEQFQFLRTSCDLYDGGRFSEAKRIAAVLRTLLHSSRMTTSLFAQLGYESRIRFLDSAGDDLPGNVMGFNGLTSMRFHPTFARHYPKLEKLLPREMRRLSFGVWWHKEVVKDAHRRSFTRSDMVRAIADQDGGVHVDPVLDRDYANLSRRNSFGLTVDAGSGPRSIEGLELASIRQIAFEVENSVKRVFPHYFEPCAFHSWITRFEQSGGVASPYGDSAALWRLGFGGRA